MKDNLSRLLPTIQREIQEVAERRERGRLEHEIRRLQKFDAIGRLAAGIAHDFNNALGVILGWAQLGCDEVADGSPLQKKLRVIIDQAQRSTGLTSQLLSFARGKVLQPRNLRLNHLVSETACFLNGVIGEAIEMEMSLTSGPNDIFGDPTQVGQILVNICLNARDAMPKGGRLLIETQTVKINEEFTPPYPHPVPGRYVLLSVSDTGMGMDPATLDHIFEPFFTTKEAGSGMGLGLATVYGIVKQHGGFLSVHSEIGRGTIFRVYLPAGTGVDEMPAPSSKERVRMGQETILLAEDHEELRSLARQMLISQGYHVLVAARSGSTVPRKPTEDSSGPPRCGDANSERTRCLSTNVRHQT